MLHRALALSLAALALVLFLGQSSLAAEKTHEGTVVKAGNGSLTMKDSQGKQHSHTIPANAAITLDGKEAKLEDLKAGFSVTVTTAQDEKTVSKVDATSAKKQR